MDTDFDARRQRALAQVDLVIDVLSAWRDRYEDDDWHAHIDWIMSVIPETERTDRHITGWLCVRGTATPGLGWRFDLTKSTFCVDSLCRSMRGIWFSSLTRRQFREAARRSNVCLPSRHATLYLEMRDDSPTPADP